jgi:Flp pilus assembly protein CpaB
MLMHRLQFMTVIVAVAGLVGVLGIAHWSRP